MDPCAQYLNGAPARLIRADPPLYRCEAGAYGWLVELDVRIYQLSKLPGFPSNYGLGPEKKAPAATGGGTTGAACMLSPSLLPSLVSKCHAVTYALTCTCMCICIHMCACKLLRLSRVLLENWLHGFPGRRGRGSMLFQTSLHSLRGYGRSHRHLCGAAGPRDAAVTRAAQEIRHRSLGHEVC